MREYGKDSWNVGPEPEVESVRKLVVSCGLSTHDTNLYVNNRVTGSRTDVETR